MSPARRLARRLGTALGLAACFLVAGYAGTRLLAQNPSGVATWFVGGAVAHDLLLFPLYAGADAVLVGVLRRRPALATVHGVPWLNHLRVPAAVAGLLLLVWFPLVLRVPTELTAASGLSAEPFLGRWLAVISVLFAGSATVFAARVFTARVPGARVRGAGRRRGSPR